VIDIRQYGDWKTVTLYALNFTACSAARACLFGCTCLIRESLRARCLGLRTYLFNLCARLCLCFSVWRLALQ
jgi:hypothetical protein